VGGSVVSPLRKLLNLFQLFPLQPFFFIPNPPPYSPPFFVIAFFPVFSSRVLPYLYGKSRHGLPVRHQVPLMLKLVLFNVVLHGPSSFRPLLRSHLRKVSVLSDLRGIPSPPTSFHPFFLFFFYPGATDVKKVFFVPVHQPLTSCSHLFF